MPAILLLCTGNLCRSVMAQGMLSARLAARGIPAAVSSAGQFGDGQPPPAEVISVMAARGIDVAGHRSRRVTAADLAAADVVLGLDRDHVRYASVLLPEVWPRAFTLRELLRRAAQAGPRAPGEPLSAWLARAAGDRTRRALLGSSADENVADPFGGAMAGYQATARLLDGLTRDLVRLCWPG